MPHARLAVLYGWATVYVRICGHVVLQNLAYMPNITIGGMPCEIVMPGGFAYDHITCKSVEDVVGPKNVSVTVIHFAISMYPFASLQSPVL